MKRIYVENFGPVQKAELELRNINLLIGEQSVGKSTLAKLITILTDYTCLGLIMVGDYAYWLGKLEEYGLDIYKDNNYTIKYDLDEDSNYFHFEIYKNKIDAYVIKNGERSTNRDVIVQELLSMKPFYHDEIFDKVNNLLSSPTDNSDIGKAIELMYSSLYIPAERIIYSVVSRLMPALTLAKSTVPKNLLRFMVDLENAKATYPQLEMPLLDISYFKENSDDYFIINTTKQKYLLSSASSGIQSTLPLLLVLKYAIEKKEYSSFVVEEPECNLFPEKQVELLKHIILLVKSENRTLTITTHSPYLLSALNNYLFAGTLVAKYGSKINPFIDNVLPLKQILKPNECSVYSLGEDINGKGIYCKSLLNEKTGMIDFNSLDGISEKMGDEFARLKNAYIQMKHQR
ncbi:MAG: AAA family ATPase [Paludibacteraceae bacterium]|nr:AAA family ATPase [Paludibacteraceae bacterium]